MIIQIIPCYNIDTFFFYFFFLMQLHVNNINNNNPVEKLTEKKSGRKN